MCTGNMYVIFVYCALKCVLYYGKPCHCLSINLTAGSFLSFYPFTLVSEFSINVSLLLCLEEFVVQKCQEQNCRVGTGFQGCKLISTFVTKQYHCTMSHP